MKYEVFHVVTSSTSWIACLSALTSAYERNPDIRQLVSPRSGSPQIRETALLNNLILSIEEQTHKVMANLKFILEGAGAGLENVVSARVFLTHFEEDYRRMDAVYESYFPKDKRPARTTVGVTALASGARIEIDVIAKRDR